VIVQGPVEKPEKLPIPEHYKEFELRVHQQTENLGVPTRMAESTERLTTDFWAKLDDDASLPKGGWDTLIRILDEEEASGKNVGCVFMSPNDRPPNIKIFEVVGQYLAVRRCSHESRERDFADWHLVDCIGTGATIFRKTVFDEGVHFVREYFSGVSDNDLCYQMHLKGILAAICVRPKSYHTHAQCTSRAYEATRYAKRHMGDSANVFWRRWGLIDKQHRCKPTEWERDE
jgi:GT2 family glycosyltransferase